MGSWLTRASQLVNLSLLGSSLGLFVHATGGGGQFVALAEQPAAVTAPKPLVPPRPEVQAFPGPGVPLQAMDTRGDAIVPPLQRRRPPPGQTSVPIVAPPDKKAAAKSKPAPVKSAAPVKGKSTPATQRVGLGVKPVEATPKCAIGLRYDSKALKCVKTVPGPAAGAVPAKSLAVGSATVPAKAKTAPKPVTVAR